MEGGYKGSFDSRETNVLAITRSVGGQFQRVRGGGGEGHGDIQISMVC